MNDGDKSSLLPTLLVGIFLIATWLVFSSYPRYLQISDELITNQDFSAALDGWQTGGRPSMQSLHDDTFSMQIEHESESQRLIQSFTNLQSGFYHVGADLRLDNVIHGIKDWQNAGIILATYQQDGKRNGSFDVLTTSGSLPWQTVEKVIFVAETAYRVDVVARMLNSPGKMQVKNISLIRVKQAQYFNVIRILFAGLWLIVGLWFFWNLRTLQVSRMTLTVVALLAIATFIGTLIPKQLVTDINTQLANHLPPVLVNGLEGFFRETLQVPLLSAHAEFSKLGHFLGFFLLAFVARFSLKKISMPHLALTLLTLALLTETLQMMTNARSASLLDVIIDSAGIIIGLLLAQVVVVIAKR